MSSSWSACRSNDPGDHLKAQNALAETINGRDEAEVIHRRRSWRTMGEVEWETLKWVDWFNNRRLLGPIGNIPPAEAEEKYYARKADLDMVA